MALSQVKKREKTLHKRGILLKIVWRYAGVKHLNRTVYLVSMVHERVTNGISGK